MKSYRWREGRGRGIAKHGCGETFDWRDGGMGIGRGRDDREKYKVEWKERGRDVGRRKEKKAREK